ncbi:MAG: 4-vinyl reductase [Candidatus Woesearchaeota archaeon]
MGELGIFRKVISGGHLSWKNGELFIWSVPLFMIPTYTHIELINSFKEKCPETNSILYSVGEKQTMMAVEYMMKKFGFKRKGDVINSVLEQSLVLGYGKFKILHLNLETGEAAFKCENNPFARHYKEIYGIQKEPVDAYLAGTKAGIMEAITGKKLVARETKCIAKGDNCCLFEIKTLKEVNQSDSSSDFSSLEKDSKKSMKLCSKKRG